jgi:eukaryotic-like serine/threonine-protein kinase
MARLADPEIRLLGNLQLPERYEVRRRIAHGGMASVWCAHDRILGRDVAIKLLAEQFAHDPTSIRRFKREARAAARLSGHPHVVTIYDVSEATDLADEGRRAFIVMEHLAGGTVADALRVGAVTREDTLRWLHEAASALDYAHGSGVVHRDIKPANFLLDRARVLHVADFGIARLGSEETITSTGYMLGTAAYLSPERALGEPATEASDRYALAVVAFELLTGERPFSAEHFAAQARLHIEQPVPRASGRDARIPRAVDAVLARGMAKQPEDRWPTATALADTLDLALTERAGRSIGGAARPRGVARPRIAARPERAARPHGAPPRPAEPPRIREQRRFSRRGLAIAALATAALGVGVAVGADHGSGTPHARVVSSAGSKIPPPAHRPTRHRATHHAAPPHPAPTPVTATPAAATTPAPTAETLEAHGHQLMDSGDYVAAIPVLRQALDAASPSSLTYAYALFNLGHSLRMAGDARAAIPILYRRLQIPNQTEVVRAELQAALQAVGAQVNGGGAPGLGAGGPPGHGKHKP